MSPSFSLELFLAQQHAAFTHLPIATSVLAALAALIAFVRPRDDLRRAWAILSLIALITVIPTILSGIQAARGRQYITQGVFVDTDPEHADIRLHQQLGIAGTVVALVLAGFGVRELRGKRSPRLLVAILAVTTALVWGFGSHMGGKALWSPDTFPAFEQPLQE